VATDLESDRNLFWRTVLEGFSFSVARQPLVEQGLLIVEVSRSHSDASHLIGLIWTSDQSETETSIPLAGFETAIPAHECPQTHSLDSVAIAIGNILKKP